MPNICALKFSSFTVKNFSGLTVNKMNFSQKIATEPEFCGESVDFIDF